MPSGEKVERGFNTFSKIQSLYDFIELWFFKKFNSKIQPNFEIVTSFPRIVLKDRNQTLQEQDFGSNTVLYIQDIY